MTVCLSPQLPHVVLSAADGAQAGIYLHGAHVAAWTAPDGREQLFMSDRAAYTDREALRGGVPVAFPQFSGFGPLINHGFARISTWEYLGSQLTAGGAATARFRWSIRPARARCGITPSGWSWRSRWAASNLRSAWT